jgi:hypothetical protein
MIPARSMTTPEPSPRPWRRPNPSWVIAVTRTLTTDGNTLSTTSLTFECGGATSLLSMVTRGAGCDSGSDVVARTEQADSSTTAPPTSARRRTARSATARLERVDVDVAAGDAP